MRFFFLVLVLFGCYSFIFCQDKQKIVIATEEYPPYTSKDLASMGIDCQIVKESFALENIDVAFEFYTGARSFELAKEGKVHGTLPWAMRPDREKFFYFSDPVIVSDQEHFFYLKKTDFKWDAKLQNYENIKNITFGAVISHNFKEKFQEAEKKELIKVERVNTIKQNFDKLFLGRIDVVICQKKVGEHILKANFTDEQIKQIISVPENEDPVSYDYLLLGRSVNNNDKLLLSFNNGLKKLKESGKYDELIKALNNRDYLKK